MEPPSKCARTCRRVSRVSPETPRGVQPRGVQLRGAPAAMEAVRRTNARAHGGYIPSLKLVSGNVNPFARGAGKLVQRRAGSRRRERD